MSSVVHTLGMEEASDGSCVGLDDSDFSTITIVKR